MSSYSKILLTAPFVALLALPTPALSQSFGPYFGVGLGQSNFRGACDGISAPDSCDDADAGVKIFGGYQFNRFAAFEFGYTDLGSARANFAGLGNQRVGARGVEFTGIGMLPLDWRFSLLARLGVFAWNQDFHDGTGTVGSSSSSGSDLTYGLGVKYDFTRSTAVRFEWQRYKNVGDPNSNGGQGDIDLFGANLVVRF